MAWTWTSVDDHLKLDFYIRLMNQRMRALATQVGLFQGYTINVGTFQNGATAPSVAGSRTWKTANTSGTSITTFSEATAGQEVLIWSTDANTTLVHNATSFILKGGANVTMTNKETRRFETVDGTNWRET